MALSDNMLSSCVMANSQIVHWGPSFTFKICAENMQKAFGVRHIFFFSFARQVVTVAIFLKWMQNIVFRS